MKESIQSYFSLGNHVQTYLTYSKPTSTQRRQNGLTTNLRWSGVAVRVSAPVRRGAAPYADGCERFFGHSHLISLLLFVIQSLSSRLTWHDFAYVTMAQKVRSGSVTFPSLSLTPLFRTIRTGSGSHMPVTPDPPLQPRGDRAANQCLREPSKRADLRRTRM